MQKPSNKVEDLVKYAGPSLVKKLRKIVTPEGKKLGWMAHLSDGQLVEIYFLLRKGSSPSSIATHVQDYWKIYRDYNPRTLSRGLTRFKRLALSDFHITKKSATKEEKKERAELKKKASKLSEQVDGIGRLGWLAEQETKRLMWLQKLETEAGRPMSITNKAAQGLRETLVDYTELQIKLGLLDMKPVQHNVEVHHKFSQAMSGVVDDGGNRLKEAASRFIDLCSDGSVTLHPNEDGVYSEPEPLGIPGRTWGSEDEGD